MSRRHAQLGLDVLLLALIVFGPLGEALFDPVGGWPLWAQVVGFTTLIEVLLTAAGLPLAVWTGFVRERRWGFSTQSIGGFSAARAKAFALGLVLASLAPHVVPFVMLLGAALQIIEMSSARRCHGGGNASPTASRSS